MAGQNFFWLRITTASAQCLRLSERFFHFALCLMSFFSGLLILIVHISSYIAVYDMYVLPSGVIKNNNNNYKTRMTFSRAHSSAKAVDVAKCHGNTYPPCGVWWCPHLTSVTVTRLPFVT